MLLEQRIIEGLSPFDVSMLATDPVVGEDLVSIKFNKDTQKFSGCGVVTCSVHSVHQHEAGHTYAEATEGGSRRVIGFTCIYDDSIVVHYVRQSDVSNVKRDIVQHCIQEHAQRIQNLRLSMEEEETLMNNLTKLEC